MDPTISILISSYGSHTWRTLAARRAYPSALNQGFHEVLMLHEPDMTLAQVRNANAERATGDFLCYLDADDELDPGFGDAMRSAIELEQRRPALFTPAVCYARGTVRPRPKLWPRMDFKVGNWCVIGTLIERSLFAEVGGFREYLLYEDWGLFAMANKAGAEVYEVPDAIYIAHHSRVSRNRAPGPKERLYWHQFIGHDVWPDFYDATTDEEDSTRTLLTQSVRHR